MIAPIVTTKETRCFVCSAKKLVGEMEELRSVEQIRNYLQRNVDKTIGLVPTMGNLHGGHESLIRACVEENEVCIVSIFVNPTQFAPGEDLGSYPRSEETDKALCDVLGCSAVFIPEEREVYTCGFGTWVESEVGRSDRNERSEGATRPTFFRGVATMVTKLICLVRPKQVYFGQKDAQQVAVVKRVVEDLWLGCCVRICETVREADGLAMSSRNVYLTNEERKVAGAIWRGMQMGKEILEHVEECVEAEEIRNRVREYVEAEWKEVDDGELLYVSVCDRWSLREVSGSVRKKACLMLCVAGRLGRARLIDNLLL